MRGPLRARPRANLDDLLDAVFFCPSCTTWRTSRPLQSSTTTTFRRTLSTTRRCASGLSSTTALNATKSIPARYQELYEALGGVRKKASAQVNLSRLQLALQGLESETPTTRVAILGLNVQETARRVARLLLADPLGDEEKWERQLVDWDADFHQGLVIRHGQPPNPNLPPPRTSVPVLYVPSNVLERNNIEILVSTLNGPNHIQGAQMVTPDAFLSPSIGTPTAANGRQTTISQPVHSCLLVTKGFDELLAAAELLASTNFTAAQDRESVRVAVCLKDTRQKDSEKVMVMDATKAETGLAAIRRSVTEATSYEHNWVDSGMPSLSSWLSTASAANSQETIPKPVQELVSSVLTNAERTLRNQASLEARTNAAERLSLSTQSNLQTAIDEFSRNAHEELQSGLATAWSSRNWRKLAWFKLFWRVDDVGLIITDLVTNAWLPRTERAVYELSGRLSQAGISPTDVVTPPSSMGPTATAEITTQTVTEPSRVLQAQADIVTDPPAHPVVVNTTGTAEIEMEPMHHQIPLASSISSTRAAQIERAITSLTSTAQQIVLKTLSITGLSAGLSGLTYVSLTPGSLYEAGTIVALGTAYALWRMQGDWFKATKSLEDGLYDEGRVVIQRIVARMRELVVDASRLVEDEVEVQSRREAEDAVMKARKELDQLQQ